MADSELIIEIDGNTKEFENTLKKTTSNAKQMAMNLANEYKKAGLTQEQALKKAWQEVERQAISSNNKAKHSFQDLGNTGKSILASLKVAFAGVIAGLAGATYQGANFEQQMKNVQAISGASADELGALTEKAKEMGIKSAFSASEAGKAFEYMAMAGWDTQAMLGGLEGIMNLASASGEELGLVSDIVTDALTAFGLQAQDAGHFADVLAMASSKSNTNVQMLGYSFKYVAPVAGALKFSIEDVAVALGLMANAGIKSEQAGTSLRSLFTRLVKPPKEASEAIKKLGLAVTNQDGTMRSLNNIVIDLRKSFACLSDAEKANVASALAGQEAMSGLLAIVNAGESDFNKLTEAINNANGKAQEMANTRLDTLAGQATLLKSTFEGIAISIYENFREPFKQSVIEVNEVLQELNNRIQNELSNQLIILGKDLGNAFKTIINGLTEAIPPLIQGFVFLIEHFKAFAIAVLAFKGVQVFVTLTTAIDTTRKALIALYVVMSANPLMALAIALGALAVAFYEAWQSSEDFKFGVMKVWFNIKKSFADGVNAIIDDLNLMIKAFNKISPNSFQIDPIEGIKVEDPQKEFNVYKKRLEREKYKLIAEQKKTQGELKREQERIQKILDDAKKQQEEGKQELSKPPVIDNPLFPVFEEKEVIKGKTKKEKSPINYKLWEQIERENARFEAKQKKLAEKREKEAQREFEQSANRLAGHLHSAITGAINGGYESTEEAIRGIGRNLIMSLADEMLQNALGQLSQTLMEIGNIVISSMKGIFGIASPSKVFKYFGYENMRGLALGMESNQELVSEATKDIGERLQNDLGTIEPQIQPSFNLQNAKDMFSMGAMLQPQLTNAVSGGGMVININSTFNLTGGSGSGASSEGAVTNDDLASFSKDIEKNIEGIVMKVMSKQMRAGGMLSK